MNYNVAQFLQEPTGSVRQYKVQEESIDLGDVKTKCLEGWLKLTRTDRGIRVMGRLAMDVSTQCSRCLEEFDAPLETEITEECLEKDLLKGVLDSLSQLTRFVNTLEGHGGNFRELLKNGKDGHFPQYMVRVKVGNAEEITYFSDEKSLMSFCQNNRDLRLLNEDLTEEEIEAYRETFEGVQRRFNKIFSYR